MRFQFFFSGLETFAKLGVPRDMEYYIRGSPWKKGLGNTDVGCRVFMITAH